MQEKYLYIDDIFAHVMIIVAWRAENFGKKREAIVALHRDNCREWKQQSQQELQVQTHSTSVTDRRLDLKRDGRTWQREWVSQL